MRATFTQPFSAPASVAEITHTQAHTHTITAPLIDVTHEFARERMRENGKMRASLRFTLHSTWHSLNYYIRNWNEATKALPGGDTHTHAHMHKHATHATATASATASATAAGATNFAVWQCAWHACLLAMLQPSCPLTACLPAWLPDRLRGHPQQNESFFPLKYFKIKCKLNAKRFPLNMSYVGRTQLKFNFAFLQGILPVNCQFY